MSTGNTLYLLHCGWLIEPDGNRIQVPAYVVRTNDGRVFLIDTGNPAALIGQTRSDPWYDAGCEIAPGDDPLAHLAQLGIRPNDVDAIVATHFDFDHAGRYDAFGPLGTTVYVQRAHMAAALSEADRYDAGLWKIPGLRWILLDGDTTIAPGLTVIRTDGHATGQQSVMVETESGPVILAADAIENQQMVDSRIYPGYWDAATADVSLQRLVDLADERDATIIFGHDPVQWATLKLSPEPYRRS